MGLELGISYKETNPIPTSEWYGPYPSVTAANLAVPTVMRSVGLVSGVNFPRTVGIVIGGIPMEYWWFGGLGDGNLVPKATPSGAGGGLTPFFLSLTSDAVIAAPATGYYVDALYDLGADINPMTGITATGSGKKYVLQNFPTDPDAFPTIFIPHVNGGTYELVARNFVVLQDIGSNDFRIVRI